MKAVNNIRMDFVNHALQIMNFLMEFVHSKIVLIGKTTPVLYVKMDSIFPKENVSLVLANLFAQDDRL